MTPRVTRSGADVLRMFYLSQVDSRDFLQGDVGARKMAFPEDVNMIERYLRDCPGTRLVVVDPLREFCATPRLMRQTLALLDDLAARYKVAIVVTIQADVKFTPEGEIRHIPRTWDEAARYVWCVTRDPCDSELRRFEPKRTSFCQEPEGIAFRVTEKGAVAWEPIKPRETKFQKCKTWLLERMSQGAVWAEEAQRDASAWGFSETMLYRARDELKIRTDRVGGIAGTGNWWWTRDNRAPEKPEEESWPTRHPRSQRQKNLVVAPKQWSLDDLEARARDLFRHGDEFVAVLSKVLLEKMANEEQEYSQRSKPPQETASTGNGHKPDRRAKPDGRGAKNGHEKKSKPEFLGDSPRM